jgi:hypothetical protein
VLRVCYIIIFSSSYDFYSWYWWILCTIMGPTPGNDDNASRYPECNIHSPGKFFSIRSPCLLWLPTKIHPWW